MPGVRHELVRKRPQYPGHMGEGNHSGCHYHTSGPELCTVFGRETEPAPFLGAKRGHLDLLDVGHEGAREPVCV